MPLFQYLSGLLWTSNRRMRKAFNRRKGSRRLAHSPYSLARADSDLGTNSSPRPRPFIFVNNPRSFSASPISSTPSPLTTPFIIVNPSPTPSRGPTRPFIHISPRIETSSKLEKKSQPGLSTHRRNPYIIVNPRGEPGGGARKQFQERKFPKNPNLNSLPRSIPISYLPMTSSAADPLTINVFFLALLNGIYLTRGP